LWKCWSAFSLLYQLNVEVSFWKLLSDLRKVLNWYSSFSLKCMCCVTILSSKWYLRVLAYPGKQLQLHISYCISWGIQLAGSKFHYHYLAMKWLTDYFVTVDILITMSITTVNVVHITPYIWQNIATYVLMEKAC
jgi:hypothetical protein